MWTRGSSQPEVFALILSPQAPCYAKGVLPVRYVVFGFLVGAMVGTVASCGTSNCRAYTCPDGCCDAQDRCVSGAATSACGHGGNVCTACAKGLVCARQTCSSPILQGGGAGGGDPGAGGGAGGGPVVTLTVTGRVTYDFVPSTALNIGTARESAALEFDKAVERPVRNGIVRIVQGKAGTTLAETVTDEDGGFSISYDSQDNLMLYALAETRSPPIQVEDNTDQDLVWTLGASLSGRSEVVNLHAEHGWTGASYALGKRAAAPFAILDSMYTASRAFLAARPSLAFPRLRCNWSPKNSTQSGAPAQGKIGTSYFDPQDNELYILGEDGVDTDEFDSHVIVHEWGHFFEKNLSRADSPGGSHRPGDELDPRLALSEGWGDAVGAMVLADRVYVDTSWNAGDGTMTGFSFDAETAPTPTDDPTPSAFSEMSLTRLLYDVYDGKNEPVDQFGVGLGPIIDVLTGPEKTTEALTTIGSFIATLRGHSDVTAQTSALDTLLGSYQISPIISAWGEPDTKLMGVYTRLTSLPASPPSISLEGSYAPNMARQNHYFVFPGNGKTVQVTGTSTQDIALEAFQTGISQGGADDTTSGAEKFTLNTTSGLQYVLVVTGFTKTPGNYDVTVVVQ